MTDPNSNSQPILDSSDFSDKVRACLAYSPNGQQWEIILALSRFCCPLRISQDALKPSSEPAFILNGYAGTGKTSIMAALVKALTEQRINTVLLAPTGRAAKVLSTYAQRPAWTIHRHIYRHSLDGSKPALKVNNSPNTVYIVDEASMIAAYANDESNLLRDLVEFVYAAPNNRMILLGDTAQLPPVGLDVSPAMEADILRSMGLRVSRATMTAIARQQAESGILYNATAIRSVLRDIPERPPKFFSEPFPDVTIVNSTDLPEALDTAYRRDGIENSLLITRSNQRATAFNRAIRTEVLYLEQEIVQGDMMLIAKNNYFWSKSIKELDFIANGDIVTVDRVYGSEVKYGFRFADVRFTLVDRDVSFDAKMMIEPLYNDFNALPRERMEKLYEAIMRDDDFFGADTPPQVRFKRLQSNPYWNALQVKYAYAVTCHKAQGGQWDNVFVDMTYLSPDALDAQFYRWLYTAVTRARRHLYIIQYSPDL